MILGIDYGTKRIGIAIADLETRLAVPVGTVTVSSRDQALQEIEALVHERRVEEIIVGIPISMDGRRTEQTRLTEKFIEKLRKTVTIPIHVQDERLTTALASQGGTDRATLDERSAVLILQSYLDRT